MSLKLQIIHANEFIKTTRKGNVDHAASMRTLAALAQAAQGVEDCHILVDTRKAVYHLSVVEVWELAEDLEKHASLKGKRIAILVNGTGELADFFKLCAQNRSYCIDSFRDFEKAIDWLFSTTDLPSPDHADNHP
jgi:hypothetical protein